ncbi:hypothetical protein PTTG_29892 [Puccinia triticina 1-1 BBBD Race 1]|uniref:Uncharacterized protein n=1 Tax=Puccinia triticina (isolate 1-1 / race 1 (BBBD)) TaxID=630390 RepID=A0A180G191_PUCT1|nr:hypothetical protein PTTG_29892 [Puccinia triticina 1-1 BBBD Race 1]
MKSVTQHLNSAAHLNAVRQNVLLSQLHLRELTKANTSPVAQRGPSDMDLDHTWPAQYSFDTELHFPQVIQPEYVIKDDDDVGFGSDSSGGHEAPSEYSDEFLSWDMFGESIIEQREEAINLAKAQDTRQAGGAPKVNWDPFNSEELKSGEVVIPTFFYKAKGKLYAKCYSPEFMPHETGDAFDIIIPADIKFTETHHQRVVDIINFDKVYSEISEIPMGDGTYITIKIGDNLYEEDNSGKRIQIELPNPWRKKAENCIIRHVPLTLYADDTSGNCSKQWNKHISYYFTLSGLHPHWSNQEYNCQFVATSNVASCLELADPIIEEINDMSINGHFAYDSILNQRVLIMSFVLVALGNSPMHAEMTSTPMPANANIPCCMCQLLVVRKEDKSLVAYVKDFFRLTTGGHVPTPPRKWEETISSIKKCWKESKDEAKTAYDDKTKAKGLKDNINVKFVERYHQRHKPGQKEEIEAIEKSAQTGSYKFGTGFDGCKDTPVEILHVLQLGIIRYLLRDFMEGLGEADRRKLEGKWESFNKGALNIPSLRGVFIRDGTWVPVCGYPAPASRYP